MLYVAGADSGATSWHGMFIDSLEETTMIRELGTVSAETKGQIPGPEGSTGNEGLGPL